MTPVSVRGLSLATLLDICGLLWGKGAAAQSRQDCPVPGEQSGVAFPVEQLDPQSRCLIGAVLDDPTKAGRFGPIQVPIPLELYEYLLDRPPLITALAERLGLGTYQSTARARNQYWVNDGEGTQRLLTLLYQDPARRIYHVDGHHEGRIFPMVRAKAVAFMYLTPVATTDGHPAVQTWLVTYTKLDDPLLAGLVRLLKPLVGDAITRKLSRGFEVTTHLGAAIAQDRERVAQQAALVPWLSLPEMQTLIGWLYTVPQRAVGSPAAETPSFQITP